MHSSLSRRSTGRISETEDFINDKYCDVLITDYLKNKVLSDVRKALEKNIQKNNNNNKYNNNNTNHSNANKEDFLEYSERNRKSRDSVRKEMLLVNLQEELAFMRDDALDKNEIIHFLLNSNHEEGRMKRRKKKRTRKKNNQQSLYHNHNNNNNHYNDDSTFEDFTPCEEVLRVKEIFGCTDTTTTTALTRQKRDSLTCDLYATVKRKSADNEDSKTTTEETTATATTTGWGGGLYKYSGVARLARLARYALCNM